MSDRVRDDHIAEFGESHPLSLCRSKRHKHVGHERDRGNTDLFEFDSVVETPRRAGSSIGYRTYGDVDFAIYARQKISLGRRVWLGVVSDRSHNMPRL